MSNWAFLNGDFVADAEAKLHYRDLSFQRGYGVFDFFRLEGNQPLFLEDHINRFCQSAEEMRLPPPLTKAELKSVVYDLLNRNNRPDTGIRLGLTGGFSSDGFTPGQPNLLITQQAVSLPTEEQRQQGIRLLSHPHQRQLAHIKSIDYLMAIWLQPLKSQKGADDFLYHADGRILECPRSNFFLVTADDRIVTPAKDILNGVTRRQVLALANEHYSVEERPVYLNELETAKEAFVTSTTRQILPVRRVDDTVFPIGGGIVRHLQQLFQALCLRQGR